MHCPIAPEQRYYTCGGLGATPRDVAVTGLKMLAEARGGRPPLFGDVLPPCITRPPRNNTNNVWRLEVSGVFRALAEALAEAPAEAPASRPCWFVGVTVPTPGNSGST